MSKQRSGYSKKRKFSANQFSVSSKCLKTSKTSTANTSDENVSKSRSEDQATNTCMSASARKIGLVNKASASSTNECQLNGYRIIDVDILGNIFKSMPCKECLECKLELIEDDTKRMGSASCLSLHCSSCGHSEEFYTSKKVGHCFEVNRRMIYGMRSIGCGLPGMKKFCSTMDMPQPVNPRAYSYHTKAILRATKDVAELTIKDAVEELHNVKSNEVDENGVLKTAISCDGTWQRRGFSSLNGCVTAISMETGKILDVEPLSKVCHTCKKFEGKDDLNTEELKAEHALKCKMNYSGSAPAMEPEGAKRMFKRSVTSHKLQYDELFGDGDSKSFSAVENIYKEEYDVVVKKKECVGHVQKRLGTALRKLKKEKKGLGGKGKLTDSMIDKMQNYYGIAIRSNTGNLEAMTNNVLATLFHCASNDEHPWHTTYCPPSKDSWCGYMRDKASKTTTYKHGKGLPRDVTMTLKPVYATLSDEALLRKCLDGKTQNQNESFNGMIWRRVPKTVFVGSDVFKVGVYDAVAHFNIGDKATTKVLEAMGLNPGSLNEAGVIQADWLRVHKADYKAETKNKTRRKVLRGQRKKTGDKNKEKEGETYAAGSF